MRFCVKETSVCSFLMLYERFYIHRVIHFYSNDVPVMQMFVVMYRCEGCTAVNKTDHLYYFVGLEPQLMTTKIISLL